MDAQVAQDLLVLVQFLAVGGLARAGLTARARQHLARDRVVVVLESGARRFRMVSFGLDRRSYWSTLTVGVLDLGFCFLCFLQQGPWSWIFRRMLLYTRSEVAKNGGDGRETQGRRK